MCRATLRRIKASSSATEYREEEWEEHYQPVPCNPVRINAANAATPASLRWT
jgi:hypothetical protein